MIPSWMEILIFASNNFDDASRGKLTWKNFSMDNAGNGTRQSG